MDLFHRYAVPLLPAGRRLFVRGILLVLRAGWGAQPSPGGEGAEFARRKGSLGSGRPSSSRRCSGAESFVQYDTFVSEKSMTHTIIYHHRKKSAGCFLSCYNELGESIASLFRCCINHQGENHARTSIYAIHHQF